ncbi:phage minor head protein [Candidatus Pacearchaeota archaeon]|jgi:SPP1 gp7 family putative phage head morphogenesis protein|nr:phage minor head protein [Candidatus Pacearchaeota archaeon]
MGHTHSQSCSCVADVALTSNENPRGCNQYTGPGCSNSGFTITNGRGSYSGVVYRGGDLRKDTSGTFGSGFYFSSEKQVADAYAAPVQASVKAFHVDLKNLFVAKDYDEVIVPVRKANENRPFSSTKEMASAITDYYTSRGYEGIAVSEHLMSPTDTIVVFNKPKLASISVNAKSNGDLPNVLRRDPTRTVGLRRRFQAEILRRLNNLKKSIWNLVVEEDAFGLKPRSHNPMVGNAEASYASVQANITDQTVLKLLQGIRDRIDADDVLQFEEQPHITVRYGFTDDDFVGNVFCATGKGGGVDATCSKGGNGETSVEKKVGVQEVSPDLVYRVAARIAGVLKFPASKISLEAGQKPFIVGGQEYLEAGHYHPTSDQVHLRSEFPWQNTDQIVAVTCHEIQHHRWETVQRQLNIESHRLYATEGGPSSKLKASGEVKPEFKKDYPVYTAMQKLWVSDISKKEKLASDDGVTEYSKSYWKDWEDHKHEPYSSTKFDLAVNETLAEMAKVQSQTAEIPGTKLWQRLYKSVNSAYAKVGRKSYPHRMQPGEALLGNAEIIPTSIKDMGNGLHEARDNDGGIYFLILKKPGFNLTTNTEFPYVLTQVQQVIRDIGVVRVKLGKLSVFELPDAEVLKLEVDSKDLHRAYKKLELLPHVDTHHNYQPHLTIAYLKPGTAGKYLFMATGLDGYELEFDTLTFSSSGREQESVSVNVFCATGAGGGVDPSCGSKSSKWSISSGEVSKFLKDSVNKDITYHVTTEESVKSITEHGVDISKNTSGVFGQGFYTSSSIQDASSQANPGRGKLTHVRVAIKTERPLDVMSDPSKWLELTKYGSRDWSQAGHEQTRKNLLKAGYDSVIMPGSNGSRVVVALTSKQVRIIADQLEESVSVNTRFAFQTSAEQTEAFRKWLANEVELQMFGTLEEQIKDAWWRGYIEEGYKQGAGRAFDDTKKPYAKGYAQDESTSDFYRGSKEQFLRSAFAQPVSVDKVKLLAGRVYTDIKGVTDIVATKVQRSLTDGIIQGKSPHEVGREMNDVLDAYKNQATAVARTETIRAHAEGQLDAMEKLGIEDVGVAVEWTTSGMGVTALGNPSPCELCAPLAGIVMKVKEARGLIPRHPNCMCSLVPANVGEDTSGQLRSAGSIKSAFRKSIKAEIPKGSKRTIAQQKAKSSWKGAGKTIGKKRPRGMVGNVVNHPGAEVLDYLSDSGLLSNTFCPTGEGGGIDPTCSPSKSQLKKREGFVYLEPIPRNTPRPYIVDWKCRDMNQKSQEAVLLALDRLVEKYGSPEGGLLIRQMIGGHAVGSASRGKLLSVGVSKAESLHAEGEHILDMTIAKTQQARFYHDDKTGYSISLKVDGPRGGSSGWFGLDPKKFDSYASTERVSLRTGRGGPDDVVTHEFGHVMSYRAGWTEKTSGNPVDAEARAVATKIKSTYAHNSMGECLAEAFKYADAGGSDPAVLSFLDKHIFSKVKKNG